MTTLRTFQNEIEDIHHREIIKQRAQALMDKEKDSKHLKGKAKEEQTVVADKTQNLDDGTGSAGANLQDLEERILVRYHHDLIDLIVVMLSPIQMLILDLDAIAVFNPRELRHCSRPGGRLAHAKQRRICDANRPTAFPCRVILRRLD